MRWFLPTSHHLLGVPPSFSVPKFHNRACGWKVIHKKIGSFLLRLLVLSAIFTMFILPSSNHMVGKRSPPLKIIFRIGHSPVWIGTLLSHPGKIITSGCSPPILFSVLKKKNPFTITLFTKKKNFFTITTKQRQIKQELYRSISIIWVLFVCAHTHNQTTPN